MNDFNNAQVAKLPGHLKQFIVSQNYERYTPIDQAVWRYVMRQNYSYLKHAAYYPYISGLHSAGLSMERIPDLQTMNDNLGKIGWGAVTVNGFIPPAAFMEYQAYRVLVIAADIRQINHIEYTPAPDIIHESAGHAPIIADTEYNNYLSYFGSIGAKAMFSSKDFELYDAIRKLSILKEADDTQEADITRAERELMHVSENMGEPSEMALLGRLHWWTVEYGLIGTIEDPKIYGAGLLSSIGESASCMKQDVKKLRYSLDAVNYPYDITKPQPQLFVTPNFQNLIDVLEQFADTMAFRCGGAGGIIKAISCARVTTAVYSSGLQVSGIFTELGLDAEDNISFVMTNGPTALALNGKQLSGHGKDYHQNGFSSPVGKLNNSIKVLEDYSKKDLVQSGILTGKITRLTFDSGIAVFGKIKSILRNENKVLLITFEDCTVTDCDGCILFHPEWGTYDMAVGEKIISVFNGAADKESFEESVMVNEEKCQPDYGEKTLELHQLYKRVRYIRESGVNSESLEKIFSQLKNDHRDDWLCALEILEIIVYRQNDSLLEKGYLHICRGE